jgi:uncharacterized protein (TIRG00374 family)
VVWALLALTATVFIAAVISSRLIPASLPRWRCLDLLPDRARSAIADAWPRLRDGLEAVRNERVLALTLLLTVVGYGLEVVTFWAFGRAFRLGLPLVDYVGVTVAVSLVRTFPITFQNIGTYEVALLGLLSREGASASDAFAYAVATRVLISATITAMGLIAMWLMAVRPRDVLSWRQQAPSEARGRSER